MPECGYRRLEPSKITVGGSIANRCVEVKTEWLMLQGLRQLGTSPSRALSVVHLSEPEPWAAPGKLRRGSPSILRASPSLTANSLRLAGRAHALNVAAEFPRVSKRFPLASAAARAALVRSEIAARVGLDPVS